MIIVSQLQFVLRFKESKLKGQSQIESTIKAIPSTEIPYHGYLRAKGDRAPPSSRIRKTHIPCRIPDLQLG